MSKQISLPHDHGSRGPDTASRLPSDLAFAMASEMCALISDPNRLKIYWLLTHCEECVINIAAAVSMSSPAVSHHLRILKNSGFIISRKEGKEVYYRTSESQESLLLQSIIHSFFQCC